jgi:hypothetical protein
MSTHKYTHTQINTHTYIHTHTYTHINTHTCRSCVRQLWCISSERDEIIRAGFMEHRWRDKRELFMLVLWSRDGVKSVNSSCWFHGAEME